MKNPWTLEELNYLFEHYANDTAKNIADHIGRSTRSIYAMANKYNLQKSEAFYASRKSGRDNCKKGEDFRFSKGHEPWNKGKKIGNGHATAAMKKTQFKKGNLPYNTLEDGAISWRERIKKNGRHERNYFIRISKGRWELLNRHIWREAHGEIPKGMIIAFKDGNPKNCVLENLEMITRGENMRRNTIHNYPEEIKSTIRAIGTLNRQINNHGKRQED